MVGERIRSVSCFITKHIVPFTLSPTPVAVLVIFSLVNLHDLSLFSLSYSHPYYDMSRNILASVTFMPSRLLSIQSTRSISFSQPSIFQPCSASLSSAFLSSYVRCFILPHLPHPMHLSRILIKKLSDHMCPSSQTPGRSTKNANLIFFTVFAGGRRNQCDPIHVRIPAEGDTYCAAPGSRVSRSPGGSHCTRFC